MVDGRGDVGWVAAAAADAGRGDWRRAARKGGLTAVDGAATELVGAVPMDGARGWGGDRVERRDAEGASRADCRCGRRERGRGQRRRFGGLRLGLLRVMGNLWGLRREKGKRKRATTPREKESALLRRANEK